MADHPSPQRVHGYCGLCIARCGTVAVVEDGRFTRLEPDSHQHCPSLSSVLNSNNY